MSSLAVQAPALSTRARSIARDAVAVLMGTAAVAVAAQFVIPLQPVPVTAQTLGVVLVGAALGAKRGALSLGLYGLLGTIGAPIFAGAGSGFGASFGFIIGFVLAAAFVGAMAQRKALTGLRALGVFAAGLAIPYVTGLMVLGGFLAATGVFSMGTLLATGLTPFITGDLLKLVIAVALVSAFAKPMKPVA